MNTLLKILSLGLIGVSSLAATTDIQPALHFQPEGLTITLTPTWLAIGHGKAATHDFGGAWICAGIITIKKRVNETLSLSEFVFQWHGTSIESIQASLYRKQGEPFLPIEENLVSDGVWKKNSQRLSFSFDSKQVLDPITTFYLVLTIPSKKLEQTLKNGSFELLPAHLPMQVQPYVEHTNLHLALKDLLPHKKTLKLAHAKS